MFLNFDFSCRLAYTFTLKNGIVPSMRETGSQNRFQTSYPSFWTFWDKFRAVYLSVTADYKNKYGELAKQFDEFSTYPGMAYMAIVIDIRWFYK